jgi:hypothetical protein
MVTCGLTFHSSKFLKEACNDEKAKVYCDSCQKNYCLSCSDFFHNKSTKQDHEPKVILNFEEEKDGKDENPMDKEFYRWLESYKTPKSTILLFKKHKVNRELFLDVLQEENNSYELDQEVYDTIIEISTQLKGNFHQFLKKYETESKEEKVGKKEMKQEEIPFKSEIEIEEKKEVEVSLDILEVFNNFSEEFIPQIEMITQLDMRNLNISNFEPLKYFINLKGLSLYKTKIEDINHLQSLKELELLDLGFTSVKDFKVLENFTKLKELNLYKTQIDDIEHLFGMKDLETLDLGFTNISNFEVLSMLKALKGLNCAKQK